MKQFSEACERNKHAILEVLCEILITSGLVLEVGSGTGQHAAFFSRNLPHLQWQPTDLAENLTSIRAWAADEGPKNLLDPLILDLLSSEWPVRQAQAIVCINTIHIVSWAGVQQLFVGAGQVLPVGGVFYAYGAYRYVDQPLEPSNQQFDRWLKVRDPVSGIRDFEAVDELAKENGMLLVDDRAMPANNRSIWWTKT